MKGVHRRKRAVSKPYRISVMKAVGKRTTRCWLYFATEAEAVAALTAYKSAKAQGRRDARQALVGKRTADLARNGDNSAMERRIAVAMVTAWQAMTGRIALVLNDNTRGDLILQREDGAFLVVQLKTTREPGKHRNNRQYKFVGVLGYEGMPVVCWCEGTARGWVADGATLDARKKRHLCITPGAPHERAFTLTSGDMQQLLTFLLEHADDWPSSTEDAARHDFPSKNNQIEMRGIDAYKQKFPDHAYAWPAEQNGHTDLIVDDARMQFKTAHIDKRQAGFIVYIFTHDGTDLHGKRLRTPYPHGVFDVLVVVWQDDAGLSHFWRIPATELTDRGYLSTSKQDGKTGLRVYGPVGRQPDPSAKCKADTWTRDFYVGSSAGASPPPPREL